jgi:hypothetical protein
MKNASESSVEPPQNTSNVENVVVDEVHQRTYVVMAPRVLTDGETYKAIRIELLKRGGRPPAKGERLVINATNVG